MADKKTLDKYNNPLGCMTNKEFEEFKNRPYEEIYQFLQTFKITQNKCPPEKKCLCQKFQCERCYCHSVGNDLYDYVFGKFDRELAKSKERDVED